MTYSADNPPDVAGKNVVLAGLFEHIGRMDARLGLQKLGAKVVGELDDSVDFIAAKGGPKLEQALAMGIAQLDEPTLAAVLGIDPFPPLPPEPVPEPEAEAELEQAPAPETEAEADPPLPDLFGTQLLIAGTFEDLGRMEVRLGLQKLGATVVKELDATLDYVVAGVKGGPKLAQALELGIPQLDEPTLVALLTRTNETKQASATQDKGARLPEVQGAVIIIAGSLEVMGRPAAKRKLEQLGAIVTDKLDRGVSYVVAGAKGGSTLFNAKELGIPHIDESTLAALVAQLPEDVEDAAGEEGPPVLLGAVVVLAGVPAELGRSQAVRRLEKLGATVTDQVDRQVKYVFTCQGGASKLFQAKELGIRELDEATLMALVADVPDDETAAVTGPTVEDIAGKKLLIAGTLQEVGRAKAKRKLTSLGAEVVDRLTDDVAWVVAGVDGGRNLFIAKQTDVPLMDEPALLTLLAQAPDDVTQDDPALPAPEELQGVRLVLAGKLPTVDRVQAKRKLTRMGAQVVDEVDANVAYVFAGQRGGRNVLVALQQKVPVFSESDLVGLLAQIPDEGSEPTQGRELPDLAGHTVLLTGKLKAVERRLAVTQLRQLGATLLDRVDDSPDYVIAGEKGGRAVFVANQESIPVLDETTLLAVLAKAVADGVIPPSQTARVDEAEQAPPDLSGASVAFTGKFAGVDIRALKALLTERGVTVHPGLTTDTHYLVVGDKPTPMKLLGAKQLGIPTLTLADLQTFLES